MSNRPGTKLIVIEDIGRTLNPIGWGLKSPILNPSRFTLETIARLLNESRVTRMFEVYDKDRTMRVPLDRTNFRKPFEEIWAELNPGKEFPWANEVVHVEARAATTAPTPEVEQPAGEADGDNNPAVEQSEPVEPSAPDAESPGAEGGTDEGDGEPEPSAEPKAESSTPTAEEAASSDEPSGADPVDNSEGQSDDDSTEDEVDSDGEKKTDNITRVGPQGSTKNRKYNKRNR